jgi:hypothetical protein
VACSYNEAKLGDLIAVMPASRDVIDAALCPRMAANNTSSTKPYTTNDAVLLDGLKSVMRTRRVIATNITIKR